MSRVSRFACVFRGAETRRLPVSCCPEGVQVFVCANDEVPSTECVRVMEQGEFGQAIVASGLPCCVDCGSRVVPEALQVPRSDEQPSDIRLKWEERRARRGQRASIREAEATLAPSDFSGVRPGDRLKQLLGSLGVTRLDDCDLITHLTWANSWSESQFREAARPMVGWLHGWLADDEKALLINRFGSGTADSIASLLVQRAIMFSQFRPEKWPKPTRRNLLFHIVPRKTTSAWRDGVGELLEYIDQFNGRRVVAIAMDETCDPIEEVKQAFGGTVDEFIETHNRSGLREVGTFPLLWERVLTHDPYTVTFYCHSKGITKPVNPGVTVHAWRRIMYETCLSNPALVDDLMVTHPVAGAFKKIGKAFSESCSTWHFSGSFHWFRNCEAFARNWRNIDRIWYGIETWPSIMFHESEAACVFHEGHAPHLNLYLMDYMRHRVEPELEQWRQRYGAMSGV